MKISQHHLAEIEDILLKNGVKFSETNTEVKVKILVPQKHLNNLRLENLSPSRDYFLTIIIPTFGFHCVH